MDVKLLIVDDYRAVREAVRFALLAAGITQVEEATSCAEALRAVRQRKFDLVLLDISLHDGNGLDTLSDIKAMDASPPVLIHSFHDSSRLLSHSFHGGASGFVVKGHDVHALVDAVQRAATGGGAWTAEQMQQLYDAGVVLGDSQFAKSAAPQGRPDRTAQ